LILARRCILVLVILTALTGSVTYFVTEPGLWGVSAGTGRSLGWAAFALMTVLSGLLTAILWKGLSASVEGIRQQLLHFERETRIGMIMVDPEDDLAGLAGGINQYLTSIKDRFDSARIQQKELEIQASAAEAERQQLETVIYSISEAVLVTDEYDELVMANSAAGELFQFTNAPEERRPLEEIIHNPTLIQWIRKTRQSQARHSCQMLEMPEPGGEKVLNLQVVLSAVQDSSRQSAGVVVVIHDLTREKELAGMKNDLVSSVSHELKTPLSSIHAYAEMLADNEAGNEKDRVEFCQIIQEQAQRLNRLIDNILNISRIESGLLQVSYIRLDPADLIREVAVTMQPQAKEKKIELVLETDRGPAFIWADRDMLFQALMNLVSNAIKYSSCQGTVRIRSYWAGQDTAAIEVEDHGIGIPAEHQGKIFDKFYRVPLHETFSAGTGLGLSLVRQIVEDVHAGTITLRSEPGRGSTFTMTLPAQGRRPAKPEARRQLSQSRGNRDYVEAKNSRD